MKEHNNTALYLDMDGVFTDFITQAHKAFKYFHLLEGLYEDELTAVGKMKLRDQMRWDIANYEDFWSKMPWERGGKKLYNFVHKNFNHDNIHILTAPLSNDPTCHNGKTQWIKDNFTKINNIVDRMLIDDIKWNYVNHLKADYQILVDDRTKNINLWIEHGGIGILHDSSNVEATIEKLSRYI